MAIEDLLAREFPVEENCIYLNHAGVAPWPLRALEAVRQFAGQCVNNGAYYYSEWVQREQQLRTQCARLIGTRNADDIALMKNTSEALSVVAHGFPWQRGDNVLICDQEFPSNRVVWESLREYGVEVRQIPLHGDHPETTLIAAADRRTRLLSVSSVQYGTGLRMDLALLGRLCRERNIAFCVDAIQGLGVIPHDVETMHIDFLMADGHKWLLGPEGVALFYCHPVWRERLKLYQYGWHMVEDHTNFDRRDWQPARSARRFECGSPNMLGIHVLSASLSLILEIGIDEIQARVLARSEYLFDRLHAQNSLELITDTRPNRYAGIVTFRHRTRPATALVKELQHHGVVCAVRGGGVRFSPHVYTRLETLDRALVFLEKTIS